MNILFQSKFFTSYQPDKGRHFVIDFNDKVLNLSFCQLLALRHQVKNIELEKHFNGENKHGFEILMLCNREHVFLFNTVEILDLTDFIRGTFAMMELNSLVS